MKIVCQGFIHQVLQGEAGGGRHEEEGEAPTEAEGAGLTLSSRLPRTGQGAGGRTG